MAEGTIIENVLTCRLVVEPILVQYVILGVNVLLKAFTALAVFCSLTYFSLIMSLREPKSYHF